jgi:hypothetical protein
MPTLPDELITDILKLYTHAHTPSTPLQPYFIALPHAASLRLVNSTFDAIVHPLLFRSLTVLTPRDFIRYFHSEEGVLVGESELAEKRRSWVKELSICFTLPELPLKEGLVPSDVGTDLHILLYDVSNWLSPLSIPAFPAKIRYVDLPPDRAQPHYVERFSELLEACWKDLMERQPQETHQLEEKGWTLERQMYDAREELLLIEESATETIMRPFFLDVNDNPILYGSFVYLDSQIYRLGALPRQPHGDYIGFPFYHFDQLNIKDRPVIYIFRSSPPSSDVFRPYWAQQFDHARQSDDTGWVLSYPFNQRHPVNVRLLGYAQDRPARERLRDALSGMRLSGLMDESWADAVDSWRWVGEAGELSRVVRADWRLEDREMSKMPVQEDD